MLYIPFGPETLYDRPQRAVVNGDDRTAVDVPSVEANEKSMAATKWYTPYISFRRWDPRPWKYLAYDAIVPLSMFIVPSVMLSATVYAVCFTFTNVLLTVETPALLGRKYLLNPQQTGLQFIAVRYLCSSYDDS